MSSDSYERSVLDKEMLVSLAIETAKLAYGRVPTQVVAGSEFWELGRIVRDRRRRVVRADDGKFDFAGNVEGDLVGLKPDGRLVEVRFVQSASSNYGPPPLELGAFETRWEEGQFEKDWHFELLDSANLGNAKEEYRRGSWGATHEELWDPFYRVIVEHRGHGVEQALKDLALQAQRAADSNETVPSGSIEPRTDGVYVSSEGDYSQFIRFFQGDRVVTVTISGAEPGEAVRGFDWDRVELPQGTYSITANHLEFVTMTASGAVQYHAVMQSPSLMVVDSYSHINGNVSKGSVFELVDLGISTNSTGGNQQAGRPDSPPAAKASRAGQNPATWDQLLEYMQSTYPLDPSHSMWPSIKFNFDDGRSQWVVIRPRGAAERGRVEIITGFAKYSPSTVQRTLERIYDLAFGGVVKIGEDLYFRDTFRLGTLDMDQFDDLLEFVAGIGDLLETEQGDGDQF